jgi:hypothetical protein
MTGSWDSYLQPGERILWEGAPLPGIRNRGRLVFLSLFGLPFLLGGIFGTVVALRHIFWLGEVGIGLFALAISAAVAILGYALVVHQWTEAATAHRTTRYVITTRCAYIARQAAKRSLQCYPILPATAIEVEHCRGYDNVWFHVRREDDNDGSLTTTRIGFEGIGDGTEAYRHLRSIQTGSP